MFRTAKCQPSHSIRFSLLVPLLLACHLLVFGSFLAQSLRAQAAYSPVSNGDTLIGGGYVHEEMAPTVRATQRPGPIEIDGILNEESWASAEPVSSFTQRRPNEGHPVSERTEVRILHDGEYLFMGARLFDSEPEKIRAALVRRDVLSDFDCVVLSLDSRHDHRTGYLFGLSPSGSFFDAAIGADGRTDLAWDPVWEGAATMDEEGWSAEWKIPLSQLRFSTDDPAGEDSTWGIQITREIRRKFETAMFAFTPLSAEEGPHRFGHLEGIRDLISPKNLEILPHLATRSEHLDVEDGNPLRNDSEQIQSLGFDLKYGLTGNLTLDMAMNPDFGQVEVDPAVLNLTQYETYFPEKRPFFVEGAEIFRSGAGNNGLIRNSQGDLFYSRRIGAAPHGRVESSDAVYSRAPEVTTIRGAVKLSGQLQDDWSVGLMGAVTPEERGQFVNFDGNRGAIPVEPSTGYFAGRVRRDFRDGGTTVGGIVTTVRRNPRSPGLEGILHTGAFVAGMDFQHTWKNREWYLNGSLSGSRVEGSEASILRTQQSSARYWGRPDATHVVLDPTRTSLQGWQGMAEFGRSSAEHWLGAVSVQAQSPGFEANDLGYVRRVDQWGGALALRYRDQVPSRFTRDFRFDLAGHFTKNFDGDLVGVGVRLAAQQRWTNFWTTSTSLSLALETDNDRITRGGPVARHPAYLSLTQTVGSDRRKSNSTDLSLNLMKDARGGWSVRPRLRGVFRPTPGLDLSLSPSVQRRKSVMQYIGVVPDPEAVRTFGSRYLFSDLRQTTVSLDTRINWTLTPALSLQVFAQPFFAAGDYSGLKELREPRRWGWNVFGEDCGTIREVDGSLIVDPDGFGGSPEFSLPDRDFRMASLRGNAVLRWEYRPGSALFLAWQQRRAFSEPSGDLRLGEGIDDLFSVPPENILALKLTYWVGF